MCIHKLETGKVVHVAIIKDASQSKQSHIVGETRRKGDDLGKLYMDVGKEFADATGCWSSHRVLADYSGLDYDQ